MRIKRFDVTVDSLRMILGPGRKDWEVEKNALPPDAEIVRIFVDERRSAPDVISLWVTSKSFPDVPEGTFVEPEKIYIKRYYRGDIES